MVKVEIDLPENVVKAMTALSVAFNVSVSDVAATAIKHHLEASIETNFEDYSEPLASNIKALLKLDSDDPCAVCVVENKGADEACQDCPSKPKA